MPVSHGGQRSQTWRAAISLKTGSWSRANAKPTYTAPRQRSAVKARSAPRRWKASDMAASQVIQGGVNCGARSTAHW